MSDWRLQPVSDLCSQIVDCVNKTAPISDAVTPFKMLRTTNVRDGWIDTSNARRVDEPTYERWTRRMRPQRGDVVLTREAPLGEVGMLRSDEPVFLGQRLVMYRADPTMCDPHFLLYSMLGPIVQAELRSLGSGATVEHLRVPDCEKLMIPCPDLAIQQRIGAVLNALDALIENSRRRAAVLKEMVGAIYREWFVHFHYPGHQNARLTDSSLGPIPNRWAVTTLGQVVEFRYGKALKKENRCGGSVAVVSSAGVVGWHNEHLAEGSTIVVGRKGNVGSVTWVDGPSWPIDTTYYVKTDLPQRYVVEQLRRTEFLNTHAAVPGLSREQAYSRPFLQPPDELMMRFHELSQVLETQASVIVAQAERLVSMRDLLLPRLVTGRVDVSSLDLDALIENAVA